MDIAWFPLDTQRCSLTFESWTMNSQEMNMTAMDLAVDLNHYKKSGEWDLIGELHVILLSLLHRLSTKTTFTDENLDLEMLGHMISNLFVINV